MKNKGIKLTQLRELFPLQADNADCFNIMIYGELGFTNFFLS